MSDHTEDKSGLTRRDAIAVVAAMCFPTALQSTEAPDDNARKVFIVPNFHPASCGWLTTFSNERVYCCNSYLDHLDRVRDDPNYRFVLSEVNNIVAIMNFHPERIPELKQGVRKGRVELVNAFFLEPTINLSGGEALVRQVILGTHWYKQVFGVRPRYAWTIDVCGTHDQMAQIVSGLGLDAMVYTRKNPTGKTLHWAESPDGSRVLCLSPGHYSEIGFVFSSKQPLDETQLRNLKRHIEEKDKVTPKGAPVLILGGNGDYALAPSYKGYPSELLAQWSKFDPQRPLAFSTLSDYVDVVAPAIRSNAMSIPTMKGGTAYDFDGFWIENPTVKTWFRSNEQSLAAAEFLATAASLQQRAKYPVNDLYDNWVLTCLNMDRNTLWGSAGGMVFESETSWDARDRLTWVQKTSQRLIDDAVSTLIPAGDGIGLFNSLTWDRTDPISLALPHGRILEGAVCEAAQEGSVLCVRKLHGAALEGVPLKEGMPAQPKSISVPDHIETDHFIAGIDAKTGALASLSLKPQGREMLGGPANVVWLERPTNLIKDTGDFMQPRPERKPLGSSSDGETKVSACEGPLSWLIEARGSLLEAGPIVHRVRFYKHFSRIDFETELNDLPNQTVAFAEFPLASDIDEVRRGIPYGFSHGFWAKPNLDLHGWTQGITPAVRWSHYALAGGGGMAIFDRGCTGRELNGRVPIIYLYNATDKYYGYPNAWLSGKGRHVLQYSIVFHTSDWKAARIPQMAWEYNVQPFVTPARSASAPASFLAASDNVVVEAVRREGSHIEVRLAECLGTSGQAILDLRLPHRSAVMTNLAGDNPKALGGRSPYRFTVRPQQIVTLQFETDQTLHAPAPIESWDAFVPKQKLAALHAYSEAKGHPPRGE
jgi:alpha-mannosidase